MTLYYISARTNTGIETATNLAQIQDAMNDDTKGPPARSLAIVTGDTIVQAIVKFVALFPEVNSWSIDQIPTFQVATLESKFSGYLNRPLTDAEVAEACAVSSGQPWDPVAYEKQAAAATSASAMLAALMASGESPDFNPDDPDSLDDTDEDSLGDAN